MYLKSSIQTSSIDYIYIRKYPYNIKHINQYTSSIYQKCNNKYMTPIHKKKIRNRIVFISDLKVFRLEMLRIRLSNLFHPVGAAKLIDLSKKSVGTISTEWWNN